MPQNVSSNMGQNISLSECHSLQSSNHTSSINLVNSQNCVCHYNSRQAHKTRSTAVMQLGGKRQHMSKTIKYELLSIQKFINQNICQHKFRDNMCLSQSNARLVTSVCLCLYFSVSLSLHNIHYSVQYLSRLSTIRCFVVLQ